MNGSTTAHQSSFRLTDYETQMLNLWHACGLGTVLENARGVDPILVYLQHLPAAVEADSIASKLYSPYYQTLKRGLCHSALNNISRSDAHSFIWMFRKLEYETSLRLIRATLLGQYTGPQYQASTFDKHHPTFAHHEAVWAKQCTLLALEGFPPELSYSSNRAVEWLSSYESLEIRFTGLPMLTKMRKSLLRLGNQGHLDFLNAVGIPIHKIKPRTAGARKYMSLKGLDRLAMMRQHAYNCQGS